jgi:hypothetical protein
MSKIKWNDDRIKQTLTAVLLISRARLARGLTQDLIAQALLDFRNDYQTYKDENWDKAKGAMNDPRDLGSLKNPNHVAYYKNLIAQVEAMSARLKKNQIQFNSLIELDKYLVAYLKSAE